MQSANHDVSPRSYSKLSMASHSNVRAPIYDDMTIAEGLLNNSKVPRRSSSFTGTQGFRRADGKFESSGALTVASSGMNRRAMRTSNTWTSSSGEVLSDHDEVDDRSIFVQEFNRLARKHGVRPMVQEENDDAFNDDSTHLTPHKDKDNWFSRKILRRTSSTISQGIIVKPERHLKHRRSISDSLRIKTKRDKLKDKDLQELVRLCGSSLLYLPSEYAAGSLALPTCFRATAQYLIQYGTATRGLFRVPGSHAIVTALYNHYCSMDHDGGIIAGTVRCPTLPEHVRCDVHDVASAFKRFLSGLPGGILGSLPLFDSLISIQSQLNGDPEFTMTKQTKVRARLIALAIATLRSQYRRELICAVFGLLCMVGRAAETSRREDERGRPLPTSDLMGYGPLGIIFGPLLVGDLLGDYAMRIANPHGGLILLPISPPKSRKERKKKSNKSGDEGNSFNTYVDKVKVANSITEMVITHWRDVVRHMKNLSALKVVGGYKTLGIRGGVKSPMLRPSASESFAIRKPPDWDNSNPIRRVERSPSPTPMRRVSSPVADADSDFPLEQNDSLKVKKQRSRSRPFSTQRLSVTKSMSVLSPTAEEHSKEHESPTQFEEPHRKEKSNSSNFSNKESRPSPDDVSQLSPPPPPRPESSCSASKEKTTVHSQPLDHIKFMGPNLSLIKGIPMEIPKTLHSNKALGMGRVDKAKAPERVTHYSEPSIGSVAEIPASRSAPTITKQVSASPPPTTNRTLMKPLPPSPPPQNALLKMGPVAWAKKSLSKNSRQSPETSTPSSNKKKPRVLVFRASTRDSEEQIPKDHRRLGGSEPVIPAKYAIVPNRSPRKVSRSLYDDPQRKRKLLELDHAKKIPRKDPLSSISHEEDLASLAELAQALNFLEEQDGANSPYEKGDVKEVTSRTRNLGQKPTAFPRGGETSTWENSGDENRSTQVQGTKTGCAAPPSSSREKGSTSECRSEASNIDNSYRQTRAAQQGIKIRDFAAKEEITVYKKYSSPTQTIQKVEIPSTEKRISRPPTPHRVLADKAETRACENKSSPAQWNQKFPAASTEKRISRPPTPHRVLASKPPVTPKAQISPQRNTVAKNSPTMSGTPRSNKFSALVAKFNNPDAPIGPDISPSRAPMKSPTVFSSEETCRRIESPKLNLIAPYTINTPSPAKSQKSSKSVITPQSRRNSTIINRKQDISGTPNLARASPASRDATPCRSVQKSPQELPPAKPSPQISRRPSPVGCIKAPCTAACPLEDIVEAPRETSSSNEDPECPFVTQKIAVDTVEDVQDDRCSNPDCSSPAQESRIYEHITAPAMEMPTVRQSPIILAVKASPSAASLTTCKVTTGTEMERKVSSDFMVDCPTLTSTDVLTFDGPNGALNLTKLPTSLAAAEDKNSRPKSCPSLLDSTGLVHPDSPFVDAFATCSTGSASPPLSGRSTSDLYAQIRALQRQLSSKNEEIRQLKKQIDARGSLKIGTLTEELREAKKEIQQWKLRAEVAEKQVETFTKIPSRSNSRERSNNLSAHSSRRTLARASTADNGYAGEASDMAARIRKALHGMDGAESPQRWSSEESSDTVVHESFIGLEIIGTEGGLDVEEKKTYRYAEKHLLD